MMVEVNYQPLRRSHDLHLPRRIWHIITGASGMTYYYLGHFTPLEMSNLLLTIGAIAFIIETLRLKNMLFNRLVLRLMGALMREKERKRYSGFVYYAFGIALVLRFAQEDLALISSLFLILGDPIASLAGIYYGKIKTIQGKTLEGSLAGFAACFCIVLIYASLTIGLSSSLFIFAFLAGITGSLAELFTFNVDDNFMIPLISGLGMTILNSYFSLFL